MKFVRWSPLGLTPTQDVTRMRDDMDRLLDTFFATGRGGAPAVAFVPPVDIEESAGEFRVRLDLPGVPPKDVQVQLTGDTLVIRGERHEEHPDQDGKRIRSERAAGRFERTFRLATPVQAAGVRAQSRDGVLEIHIPKAEEARVREIPVQAE